MSRHGLAADESKIKVIIEMPPPKNPKDVQVFMGHVNYHRRYIHLFAELAKPLYALLTVFEWTDECDYAFNELKSRLCSAPLLRPPKWDLIFHVHTDASGQALGVVLTQPGEHQKDYPIYFASRQFNEAEANYTVTEREALAMVYSVKKFRYYLLANPFKFFVDHQALVYLVNRPCSTGRITRWLLILQEFDFEIVVRKGKQHFMADHMSRLTSAEPPIGVDDELPDVCLFQIETVPEWATDVVEYLMRGRPDPNMTKKSAKRLIRKVAPYTLLVGKLYRLGKDGILRRCLTEHEMPVVIFEIHEGICGGHFPGEITTRKALKTGYWWPTMAQDIHDFVKACDVC